MFLKSAGEETTIIITKINTTGDVLLFSLTTNWHVTLQAEHVTFGYK